LQKLPPALLDYLDGTLQDTPILLWHLEGERLHQPTQRTGAMVR